MEIKCEVFQQGNLRKTDSKIGSQPQGFEMCTENIDLQ